MTDIVKINLENEMDLVLAHRHSIKLSEFCGLSRSAQTIFATAVSEISRCAIGHGKRAYLKLGIDSTNSKMKFMVAAVINANNLNVAAPDGLAYARRLLGELTNDFKNNEYIIRATHLIPYSGLINNAKIELFKNHFKNAPPISPYEEIRKKNIQLIDLAEKLRKSEERYQLLTDSMPLMMFALNNKPELEYFNKGLSDYLALKEDANQLNWQQIVHTEDFGNVWRGWEKSIGERNLFSSQGRIRDSQTGKYEWHMISIVPVKHEKDVSVKWIGFFANIHAQKMVEETLKDNKELKIAQAQLKAYQHQLENKINELNASNRDLEQFAYIASHDLQEPLRKIKTYALLMDSDAPLPVVHKNYLSKILKSVNRMSALITDVLEYSRINRSMVTKVPVDLNLVLQEVRSDLDLVIKEKGAVVESAKLPTVVGIPAQLSQLLYNLINNSLKFCNKKPLIEINYRALEPTEKTAMYLPINKSYGKISISDNGIGFEQQFAEKIFAIFQRLNSQQAYAGTGIGLALCKKIVENHQGIISAHSEPEHGATFDIVLPVEG